MTRNQTLVELGCRVMTAATFSSLITGDPFSHLGATLLPIGWSLLWP